MRTTPIILAAMLIAAQPLDAQIVADGATSTLSNITNNITGNVTVGTNGSFTLLVLSDNALLTNSGSGIIGANLTAKSNEVQLLSASARWLMGTASLFVGSNGAFNRLMVSNGASARDGSGFLGFNASGSNNQALVTGSGSLWNSDGFYVGFFGAGNQLVASNGGVLQSILAYTGVDPTSSNNLAIVTGPGSLWTNQLELYVGLGGASNQLLVSNGGTVRSGHGYVGVNATASNNLALVTGAGSVWSNATDLEIGAFSAKQNQMTVGNGARVYAGVNGLIGSDTNANGNSVIVSDPGSGWLVGSNLYVGSNGPFSRLTISNGGLVRGYEARIGQMISSSNNLALVTGVGSMWTNQYLDIGFSGRENQLIVSNGGWVGNSSIAGIGVGLTSSNNLVLVTGGGSVWSNGSYIAVGSPGNRLVIEVGGQVYCPSAFFGSGAGAINNQALVNGSSSLWTVPAFLTIGRNAGFNQLVVSNGGTVSSGVGEVGGSSVFDSSAVSNQVVVTGTGSVWSNWFDLKLGNFSGGNGLVVSNGAAVYVGGNGLLGANSGANSNSVSLTDIGTSWLIASNLYVGSNGAFNLLVVSNGASTAHGGAFLGSGALSSNNFALVTGTNSVVTNRSGLRVGESGSGNRLVISNGARLESFVVLIGFNTSSSNNEATLTGAGSRWNASANINVGSSGKGNRFVVSNGGRMRNTSANIGTSFGSSNNLALVTGPDSSWTNLGPLRVGTSEARNTLVVSNQGLVSSEGVIVGLDASSTNNRSVVDGGTLLASDAGVGALDIRRGTNVLNAGLIDVDLLLLTNTQGFFEFNGGMLITRGAVISNFASFVVGETGTTPAIWDVRSGTNRVLTSDLLVGHNSSFNQLFVTNAAALTTEFDGVIGYNSVAKSNSAVIAGAGSSWTMAEFLVGRAGAGNQLVVSNGGGLFVNGISYFGANGTSSNNFALVTGPGSLWTNALDLIVGDDGPGCKLVVSNGGTIFAGALFLGNFPASTNNRVVVDGGTLRATNAAGTGLLDVRRGTNVLNAGLVEVDQLLVTNALGAFEFNGGTLSLKSGSVNNSPPFRVGNGVSPATLLLAGTSVQQFVGGLIVSSNAVLTGNGTLSGPVTVQSGGKLIPGTSIGKMIFNSTPSLQGSILMEISKNGTTLTNDQVQAAGALTYGGSLIVSNLGPTALAHGDKFKLFSATSYSGSFTSITLPPLAPMLQWKTNLLLDGSIEVFGPPAIPISTLSLGAGGARVYTQDFNSLGSGGGTAVWENNVTLLGWYAAQNASPITSYRISNGSDNTEGLFSFGFLTGPSTSDRALGSIAENPTGNIAYGLCFSNDTANSVSNFTVTYTGEQWRNGGSPGVTNTLSFWFRVSPTVLTNPEPGIVTNWTEVTNLDFVSPTLSTHPTGLDGNDPANQHSFSAIRIPGLVVPQRQNVFFRWHDANDSGADQGMALDDLTISFAPLQPQITSITVNPTNRFAQLTGQGESNLTYGIEAASNLNAPIFWQRIGSNTANSSGVFQFTDTNAPAFPMRFYRALTP